MCFYWYRVITSSCGLLLMLDCLGMKRQNQVVQHPTCHDELGALMSVDWHVISPLSHLAACLRLTKWWWHFPSCCCIVVIINQSGLSALTPGYPEASPSDPWLPSCSAINILCESCMSRNYFVVTLQFIFFSLENMKLTIWFFNIQPDVCPHIRQLHV